MHALPDLQRSHCGQCQDRVRLAPSQKSHDLSDDRMREAASSPPFWLPLVGQSQLGATDKGCTWSKSGPRQQTQLKHHHRCRHQPHPPRTASHDESEQHTPQSPCPVQSRQPAKTHIQVSHKSQDGMPDVQVSLTATERVGQSNGSRAADPHVMSSPKVNC